MRAVAIFLFVTITSAHGAEFKRLDPHGSLDLDWKSKKASDLKNLNQCTTCHVPSGNNLAIKGVPAATCTNCHNASPHSGALDHMGKTYNGQAMTCLSCHRPHRGQKENLTESPGGNFFSPGVTPKAPAGFTKSHFEGASGAMLARRCTECHKW